MRGNRDPEDIERVAGIHSLVTRYPDAFRDAGAELDARGRRAGKALEKHPQSLSRRFFVIFKDFRSELEADIPAADWPWAARVLLTFGIIFDDRAESWPSVTQFQRWPWIRESPGGVRRSQFRALLGEDDLERFRDAVDHALAIGRSRGFSICNDDSTDPITKALKTATSDGATVRSGQRPLSKSEQLAAASYAWVQKKRPEKFVNRERNYSGAYEILKEAIGAGTCPVYQSLLELPSVGTWQRYVCKALGKQPVPTAARRQGREHGSSIAEADAM